MSVSSANGSLLRHFPKKARELLAAKGAAVVAEIGEDALRNLVVDLLNGKNPRDQTERLTRRRLTALSLALRIMYDSIWASGIDVSQFPQLVVDELAASPASERTLLLWMIGQTNKGGQNLFHGDLEVMKEHAEWLRSQVEDSARMAAQHAGYDRRAMLKEQYLAAAVGAMTLTVRGSEKSANGKTLERLVLAGLLHIFGLRYVPAETDQEGVFWLSSVDRSGGREADATAIFAGGGGVRFDIGFIGQGNPEIVRDKLSRYSREAEVAGRLRDMATVILADTISEDGGTYDHARQVDAHIFAMHGCLWPVEVSRALETQVLSSFKNPFAGVSDAAARDIIRRGVATAPFGSVLSGSHESR